MNYPVWWFNILDVHGKKYVDSPSSIEQKGPFLCKFQGHFSTMVDIANLGSFTGSFRNSFTDLFHGSFGSSKKKIHDQQNFHEEHIAAFFVAVS